MKQGSNNRRLNKKDKIFIFMLSAIPMLQFLIFYVGVNLNSIILPFQRYDLDIGKFEFLGFNNIFFNFKNFISDLKNDFIMRQSSLNSLKLYFWSFIVGMPLSLLFSYCIYKKLLFSEFFKVILFIPQIVSGIVFVLIFKYIVEYGFPIILDKPQMPSLITNPQYGFNTIMIFSIWLGFGGGLILYLGAMNRVPESLIEYGKLEGITALKEFWYIVIPMVFPTITAFIITSFVSLFTSQGSLFSFFGTGAPNSMQTFGYYFFVMVIGDTATFANYPYAGAAALIFTIVLTPIVLGVKHILEKYGPSVEF